MVESIGEVVVVGTVVMIVSVGIFDEDAGVDVVAEGGEVTVSKSVVVTITVDGKVDSSVETRVCESVKVTVTVGEAEVSVNETSLLEDTWSSMVPVGNNTGESVAADEAA